MTEILDLSSNNPVPYDLNAVARSGVVGVIFKATEGANYTNPALHPGWEDAKAAGLWRSAYHFARPFTNSPQAEAVFFANNLPALEPGDGVALDLEDGGGDLSAWALAWVRAVEQRVGFRPWFYSYSAFLTEHLGGGALGDFPLWLANYGPVEPLPPAPWARITAWQYTETGNCPGITGNVDRSRTSLDAAGLRALGKPSPVPPAPPTFRTNARVALKTAPSHASSIAIDEAKRPVMLEKGAEVLLGGSSTVAGEVWRAVSLPNSPIHGFLLASSLVADAV